MPHVSIKTDKLIAEVLDGLTAGIPLAEICRRKGMPSPNGWRDWCAADEALAIAYARAREDGFDAIAADALRIADTPMEGKREKLGKDGLEIVTEDMLGHRRLQVETRLKLLAKWDPKRFGDATTIKHADADGGKLPVDDVTRAARLAALAAQINQRMNGDDAAD